jgi:hypothetical protein
MGLRNVSSPNQFAEPDLNLRMLPRYFFEDKFVHAELSGQLVILNAHGLLLARFRFIANSTSRQEEQRHERTAPDLNSTLANNSAIYFTSLQPQSPPTSG